MSLFITDEEYNGASSIHANGGEWVDVMVDFLHRVDHVADEIATQITYFEVGGEAWFQLTSGEWDVKGFVGGKNVEITAINGVDIWAGTRTISYIDGNKMFLTSPIGTHSSGTVFPSYNDDGSTSGLAGLIQQSTPEGLEFDFNLTPTDSVGFASVVDGEITRFRYNGLTTLFPTNTDDLEQIGNKSGSYIVSPEIYYIGITDGFRAYRIRFKVFMHGIIQNGFDEPEYLNGVATLGAISRIRVFSEVGNPNSILQDVTENTFGDIGGFNENFNSNINPYTVTSTSYSSGIVGVIDGISYSDDTDFIATIEGADFDVINSEFTIGMTWRTVDDALYQNKTTNFGQNTATLAPTVLFAPTGIADPTVYNGNIQPSNGVQWSFENLKFQISGTTLTVEGTIHATGTNSLVFEELGVGEKRITLWVSHNRTDQSEPLKKRTAVTLFDTDAIKTPMLGSSFPVTATMYTDHADIDVTALPTRLTTEDDTRYTIAFNLAENIIYSALKHKVSVRNSTTGEEFTLEEYSVDFTAFLNIGGKYEIYSTQERPFNLPPSSEKHLFKLVRVPVLDVSPLYAFKMDYGFLNRWEYWVKQANAHTDFFDPAQAHDGLNKNWQRFSSHADWGVRMTTTLISADTGQEHTYFNDFEIRPYEDEDVTTVLSYLNLEDGTTPTALPEDSLIEVTTVLTWNVGVYNAATAWAQATIEDFESGNRWLISSHLPHGGVSENPLEPIDGAIGLNMVIMGNVATLKYIIDTSKTSAANISLTHRIYSNEQNPISKLMEDGTPKENEQGGLLKQRE